MNILKYSPSRFFLWFLILGGMLSWGWFVAMEDEVIEFYEKTPDYNLLEDASFQKYLGNGQYLVNADYVPWDLISIESDFTANSARKFLLRKQAAAEFADLARHFWKDTNGDRLFITSTYRSAKLQESLLKKGCSRAKCAEVWSSEHQLWLALDLGVMTKQGKYIAISKWNKYYQRLATSGADWWFHNTYQKWIDIDGQMEEGRHWRFLWTELAQTLRDQSQSFSEWYIGKQQTTNRAF